LFGAQKERVINYLAAGRGPGLSWRKKGNCVERLRTGGGDEVLNRRQLKKKEG